MFTANTIVVMVMALTAITCTLATSIPYLEERVDERGRRNRERLKRRLREEETATFGN